MIVLVLALSLTVAWLVTRMLVRTLTRQGIVDVPNARSLHSQPRPRGGGIGILAGAAAGVAAAWALGMRLPPLLLFGGVLLVALVGFADDWSGGLPVWLRLSLQLVAAGAVAYDAGGLPVLPLPPVLDLSPGVLAVPLGVLWILAVTNIYNFLDGIDGYAGLHGVIAGVGLGLVGRSGSAAGVAVAGACAGFLVLNWHPARIFMGDVGSGALGFALAALPLYMGTTAGGGPVFVVALCLWFFLADGTYTLLRRLAAGERVWEAHRSHVYQRLVQSGVPHDVVAARVGAGSAVLGGLAVASERAEWVRGEWLLLACAVVAFVLLCRWARSREQGGRRLGVPDLPFPTPD